MVKQQLLRLEAEVLDFAPTRFLVRLIDRAMRRLLWAWGRIRFGALVRHRGIGCVCHWNVELKYPDNIHLGERVVIGVNASIGALSRVIIGDHVRISREVIIETAGLDFTDIQPPYRHTSKPIVIEDGVWLGSRAMVLAGVTVGKNSVIAAGAIVTKDIPANSVAAGVPAKVIGSTRTPD